MRASLSRAPSYIASVESRFWNRTVAMFWKRRRFVAGLIQCCCYVRERSVWRVLDMEVTGIIARVTARAMSGTSVRQRKRITWHGAAVSHFEKVADFREFPEQGERRVWRSSNGRIRTLSDKVLAACAVLCSSPRSAIGRATWVAEMRRWCEGRLQSWVYTRTVGLACILDYITDA